MIYNEVGHTIVICGDCLRLEVVPQLVGRYLPKVTVKPLSCQVSIPVRGRLGVVTAQLYDICKGEAVPADVAFLIGCLKPFSSDKLHNRVQTWAVLLLNAIFIVDFVHCTLHDCPVR